MNKTNISWADYSWNPITGCTRGCSYCYARKVTERWPDHYPNGFNPAVYPEKLNEPKKVQKPSIIFVGSMGDLFDPNLCPGFVDRVFDVMVECPQHHFMLLTKRVERVVEVMEHWRGIDVFDSLPKNIHLGFTATNSKELREGNPDEVFDFVSLEPLLDMNAQPMCEFERLKLVIVGGLTPGKPLHEIHPNWLDAVIRGCEGMCVPLHYKHAGSGGPNPTYKDKVYDAMIDGRQGK